MYTCSPHTEHCFRSLGWLVEFITELLSLCIHVLHIQNTGSAIGSEMEKFISFVCQKVADQVKRTLSGEKLTRAAISISFAPHKFAFVVSREFEKVGVTYTVEPLIKDTPEIRTPLASYPGPTHPA